MQRKLKKKRRKKEEKKFNENIKKVRKKVEQNYEKGEGATWPHPTGQPNVQYQMWHLLQLWTWGVTSVETIPGMDGDLEGEGFRVEAIGSYWGWKKKGENCAASPLCR